VIQSVLSVVKSPVKGQIIRALAKRVQKMNNLLTFYTTYAIIKIELDFYWSINGNLERY
jgi:hypothetical protein